MARDVTDLTPIASRDELVAWLAAGCKPAADFRIGTEHEKFVYCPATLKPLASTPAGISCMGLVMHWRKIMLLIKLISCLTLFDKMCVAITLGLILNFWLRTESNADRRQFQQELAADRRDLLQIIREMKDEMKDFHGRMCAIEERNKGKS